MAPTLYMVPPSPPVRAVLMFCKHMNIELQLKQVDIANGENRTPEFLKLNPLHTVPVLVDDDGTTIFDSHAILVYLLKKYGSQTEQASLYPQDAKRHALVHQIMHFDASILFARGKTIMGKLITGNKTIAQEDIDALHEVCGWLNTILEGRKYAIGDTLTIADFSLLAITTSVPAFDKNFDFAKYPNIDSWVKNIKALPFYEANKGVEVLIGIVKKLSV